MAEKKSLADRLAANINAGFELSKSSSFKRDTAIPTSGDDVILPGEDNIIDQTFTFDDGRKITSIGYLCKTGRIISAANLFPRYGTYVPVSNETPANLERVPDSVLLKRTTFNKPIHTFGEPNVKSLPVGSASIFVFNVETPIKFKSADALVSVFGKRDSVARTTAVEHNEAYGLIEVG